MTDFPRWLCAFIQFCLLLLLPLTNTFRFCLTSPFFWDYSRLGHICRRSPKERLRIASTRTFTGWVPFPSPKSNVRALKKKKKYLPNLVWFTITKRGEFFPGWTAHPWRRGRVLAVADSRCSAGKLQSAASWHIRTEVVQWSLEMCQTRDVTMYRLRLPHTSPVAPHVHNVSPSTMTNNPQIWQAGTPTGKLVT